MKIQMTKKRLALKVLEFAGLRAVELIVLYFFYRFVSKYFSGFYVYAILGAAAFVYLLFIVGCYIDDYRERHRYDDVVF